MSAVNRVKRNLGVAVLPQQLCISVMANGRASSWPFIRRSSLPGGDGAMMTLAVVQVGASPEWVGPTMAISLAVLALSFLGLAVAVGLAALKLAGQVRKVSTMVDGLQDDIARTL